MSNPTDTNQASEADKAVMIGFLYGIQSDFLPDDEVRHRVAGFRNTQGYKDAIELVRNSMKPHELRQLTPPTYGGDFELTMEVGE